MKYLLLPLLLLLVTTTNAQQYLLVDTHNDVLSSQLLTKADLGKLQAKGNFDLVRAAKGGLNAQVFSIWCDESFGKGKAFARANREIDSLYALIKRYPNKITLVRNAAELKQACQQHRLAALIGVEGGHMIEDSVEKLDSLAKRGMRYLTLTWNNSTPWASSARDETARKTTLRQAGLTAKGKEIVTRLNTLGVMVDISHVGEATFYDVLATTTKPVIASHSSAYAICPNRRNLKDDQLKALAKNGGVVFVNFYSGFIDPSYNGKQQAFMQQHKAEVDSLHRLYGEYAPMKLNEIYKAEVNKFRPPLSLLIKHIDHIVKLIGADHVGIGSDFDGSESFPLGLDSVSDYPKIAVELRKIGYKEADISKIMGGNFLRVLAANTGR
ncbi:dipeptidase [Chitinophaga pendula]|uniref:dipeptidase n=1 Tax=Chitinophaga TaxID=79328 RepID=UPI000BAFE463|nr:MULTISPECIES: dipeptidase [Chitinophaga]ASZ09945.1 dipeptidase [Chitinophaga sp. MD30]UCJ07114.1 dipeptidase [Chitinophaga pendula]